MINDSFYQRRFLIIGVTIGIVLLYILRLYQLQIAENNYRERADNNAYFLKPIYPERGIIRDRKGRLLVSNLPSFDLMVEMRHVRKLDTLALAQLIGISQEELKAKLEEVKDRKRNRGYSPHTPQLLISQLGLAEASKFEEQLFNFPGFHIQRRSKRLYHINHAAHILGYLSEANPSDLKRDSLLSMGDFVGKSGVERSYDRVLRGVKGAEVLLRDARGRIRGKYNNGLDDIEAINGEDLTLSIDSGLQAFGETLLQGKRGAIVCIEPSSGEILAMVDAPSYDPNLMTGKDKGTNLKKLEQMAGKPLFSRALMGTYPPGSTFKLAQGAVLLSEGAINSSMTLSCHHGYPLLKGRPRCHSHGSPLPLVPAIATSCNSYFSWGLHFLLDDRAFYPTIQEAFEHWKNKMVRLGFGYPTGIDLKGEKRGYIPNSKVYDKSFKGKWTSSSIISIAIGQGEILATPLQIANMGAVIANRGYYIRPHVVKSISNMPIDTAYTNHQESGISQVEWETIATGMAMAVTSGTCRAANFAPGEITVCGKTGTAENPHGKDHSAFVGFAPKDKPAIVVAVYVENGGFGAQYGVPIGRLMMEYYLRDGQLSGASLGIAQRMQHSTIAYRND